MTPARGEHVRAIPVDLIQVPYDSGRRGERMGAGPLRLVETGLADRLADGGRPARVVPVESTLDFPTEATAAFELAATVADRVRDARREGRFPLVLSGNCMTAVGTVAGLEATPAVVWFDAHGDLNTPETTRSGFLDGMAISVLTGRCWRAVSAGEVGLHPVPEERVVLAGARDLDPAEVSYLDDGGVAGVGPEEAAGALRGWLEGLENVDAAYLHVDLDVLDPSVGRANHFAAPGGMSLEGLLSAVEAVGRRLPVAAAGMASYDPAADEGGAVAEAAGRLAETVLRGVRESDRPAGDG